MVGEEGVITAATNAGFTITKEVLDVFVSAGCPVELSPTE
jgi:hypothetical protein